MISGEKEKNNRPIVGQLSLTYAGNSLLLLLLLSPAIPSVRAQPGPNGSGTDPYPYARFSPSMAIIIAVLVTALFFMGFFSIYIRRCSDRAGGSVRPILSLRSRRAAAARGLDAEVIETFPTLAYSAVKGLKIGKGALECAVCLNEFEDDETLRLIPKCDHVFHPECIDAWLASHVTCPVCRAELVPQPGESLHLPAELNSLNADSESHDNQETDHDNQQNGDVSIHVERPPVEMMDRNPSLKQNLPPRSRSERAGPRLFERFRSHSTGHSLVQPGENVDRFTLRLPEDVRKQVLKRAHLNRTASNVVVLPREGSSRRGFRAGEGSSRGRSYRRLESLDRPVKSDRWGFSRMPSFLTRALSVRSPKFGLAKAEASTSAAQPKGDDSGRVSSESGRPPV